MAAWVSNWEIKAWEMGQSCGVSSSPPPLRLRGGAAAQGGEADDVEEAHPRECELLAVQRREAHTPPHLPRRSRQRRRRRRDGEETPAAPLVRLPGRRQ